MARYKTTIDLSNQKYLRLALEKYAPQVDEWDGWKLDGDQFTYYSGVGDMVTWLFEVSLKIKPTSGAKEQPVMWAMKRAMYSQLDRLYGGCPSYAVTVTRV
jgi:hypothetical protein